MKLMEMLITLSESAMEHDSEFLAECALDLARVMKKSGEFNSDDFYGWDNYYRSYLEGLVAGVVYYPVLD